jgi:signal transduction histidine kinase
MVAAYQHSGPRQWAAMEVEFLAQIAAQLSVAIQNAELLTNTRSRADDLHQSAEQSRILFDVVSKIRESLDLQTIFKTMVTELRRSLKADRVGVYEFDLQSEFNEGRFVAEDVLNQYPPALGADIHDHCFGDRYATKYSQGQIYTLMDLHTAKVEECYRSLLERFEIRALVIAPIMKGGTLWGLLCIHQCSGPRDWSDLEIQFVKQVATQLSVALRQSDLLAQTRDQADKIGKTLNDLQQAQLQIIQSEKMAGLGQLVAGVAHEINNPVSYIHGNLDHAQDYLSDLIACIRLYQKHYPTPPLEVQEFLKKADIEFVFKDIPKLLQSMQMGTDRICEIVASLRNFSRLDEAEFKTVNIHDGIDSTLMLLQNRLKPLPESPEIQIVKDYQALPLVECYPGQLNQVFMNLLANSIDALQEYNQGRSLQDLADHPSHIRISTSVNPTSQWITISISDNGPGMTDAVCNQLFDPFFTTKSVGKGTGLGLSISYQIVAEKHHGKLYCTSEPGKGAEFVIEIPVHQLQE